MAAALLSVAALTAVTGVALAADKKPVNRPASKAPAKPPATEEGKPASAQIPGDGAAKPAASTQPANAGRPNPVAIANDATLTDAMVEQAIRKGAKFLLSRFDAKTNWVSGVSEKMKDDEGYAGGLDSLAVYALMQSGLALKNEKSPENPALAKADSELKKDLDLRGPAMGNRLDAMIKFNFDKGRHQTYSYGLRATALALYISNLPDRTKDNKDTPEQQKRDIAMTLLTRDALWCEMATNDGSYTYAKAKDTPKTLKDLLDYYAKLKQGKQLPVAKDGYDNSNCQYGLLGAWSAAEAGVEINTLYWYLVANHWTEKQHANGQWGYGDGENRAGTVNMTAAGLASMLVTHEYIEPAMMTGAVGREPYNAPIKKGLAWFEQGNNGVSANGGYGMYGIERVGLASGFKFFGQNDWYKTLATRITKLQQADGSWKGGGLGGEVVDTCYYLLFLSRGRHPILMNKLRFDGDAKNVGYWANRPRDAANLARSIGRLLERPLNWQIVNVNTNWQEWLDGPILSLNSHQPFKFSEEELTKIRNYVYAGGMLYTQSDGASPQFDKYAGQLAAQLFHQDLIPVPPEHPLYSTESLFKINPAIPLKMVSNGSRVFMLHSNIDMARYWQARDDKGKGKPYFQMGVNMFVYASGKRDLRNRLESLYVSAPAAAPIATFPVARLSYNGPWDPEPGAWSRYVNWFQRQTSYKLVPTEVKMAELKPFDPAKKGDPTNYRFAHLTGTMDKVWLPENVAGVKAFVESGGVLLLDVTGGMNKFDASAQDLMRSAFPESPAKILDLSHPLLSASAPGMEDVTRRTLRPAVMERMGRTGAGLMIVNAGKGAVIYSSLDITSGMLGTNTCGVLGYDPAYSMRLLKNIILWSVDGAKQTAPPPPEVATPEAAAPAPVAPEAPVDAPAKGTAPAAPPESK